MATLSDVTTKSPISQSVDDVILHFAVHDFVQRPEYAIVTSRIPTLANSLVTSSSNDSSWYSTNDESTGNVVVKAVILVTIMTSAIIGNLLVVVSVLRYDRLRRVANSFIVSLAFADLLVAAVVMPFNASQVNRIYGVISSTVSFWTPAVVMIFTYVKIYREARRQEQQIAALTLSLHLPPVSPSTPRLPARSNNLAASTVDLVAITENSSSIGNGAENRSSSSLVAPGSRAAPTDCNGVAARRASCEVDGQRQRLSNERRMMKREHKAAKTLGVIMGAFLVCWLPFFTWYLTASLCSDACPDLLPEWSINVLFWIGYANSALNPIIYPCFNRDFREAFRRLLTCNRACSCSTGVTVVASVDSYHFQQPRPSIVQGALTNCWTCFRRKTGARHHSVVSETTRLNDVMKIQPTIPMITLND